VVKETKRKVLPDLDDAWVSEVSEFTTVDDLRADIAERITLVGRVQAQMAVREQVLEGLAGLVELEAPLPLVNAEMERRLHDLAHRLEAQGVTIPQYLMLTGQDQQAFVDELRVGCARAVLADLALRSVVEQEGVVADDAEVDAEVARLAERLEREAAAVRAELERNGAIEPLRSDIARSKAVRLLVDRAEVVDPTGAPVDLTLPEPTTGSEPGSESASTDAEESPE
jgi:trigger factor